MPLTGISLKFKSLDPSNCDPDEEEEEECCYRYAAAHYESLVDSVIHVINLLEVKIGVQLHHG
jgi:hypothetical protein